jgi:hypothetical protein
LTTTIGWMDDVVVAQLEAAVKDRTAEHEERAQKLEALLAEHDRAASQLRGFQFLLAVAKGEAPVPAPEAIRATEDGFAFGQLHFRSDDPRELERALEALATEAIRGHRAAVEQASHAEDAAAAPTGPFTQGGDPADSADRLAEPAGRVTGAGESVPTPTATAAAPHAGQEGPWTSPT